jgi:hypothetical protein
MKSAKLDCQEQREETVCRVEWEILDINRIEISIGGSADYTWLKMKAPGPLEAHTYRYWPALVLMNLAPTPSPVYINTNNIHVPPIGWCIETECKVGG